MNRLNLVLILVSIGASAFTCSSFAADDAGGERPSRAATRSIQEPVQDEMVIGREVFHRKCMKCHRSGRGGAPVRDRPGEWRDRLEQDTETLIRHALDGHTGARGTMPPKGGFEELSDAEVAAAVRYVVTNSRGLIVNAEANAAPCEGDACSGGAKDFLLLELLWYLIEGESKP